MLGIHSFQKLQNESELYSTVHAQPYQGKQLTTSPVHDQRIHPRQRRRFNARSSLLVSFWNSDIQQSVAAWFGVV
jgi:hypothetical protein